MDILKNIIRQENWFNFIYNIIYEIDKPIEFNHLSVLELLVKIDDKLKQLKTKQRERYHSSLMDIYIDIEPFNGDVKVISLLHYLFSKIKIRGVSFDFLEKQILSEELIDVYDGNINLHASLLASIRSYIPTMNKTIENYILKKNSYKKNLSVLEAHLTYLYRKSTSANYFSFVSRLFIEENLSQKEIKLISSNIEDYQLEIGEEFYFIYEWYFKLLRDLNYKKNENVIKLDQQLIKWINYENLENKDFDVFGLFLITLLNDDILLPPVHHYNALRATNNSSNIEMSLYYEVTNIYLQSITKKRLEYKIIEKPSNGRDILDLLRSNNIAAIKYDASNIVLNRLRLDKETAERYLFDNYGFATVLRIQMENLIANDSEIDDSQFKEPTEIEKIAA